MPRSLHEKTADVRRGHILDAATRVFARRGFHRSTIREVAKEAGVADGTIYNSFKNKTALLLALLDPLDERAAPLDLSPSLEDAEAFIRTMFRRAWKNFSTTTLEVVRIVLSEALVDPDLRRLYLERVIVPAVTLPEPIFARLASTRRLRPIDSVLVTRALAGTVMGFVMLRLLGDQRITEQWDSLPDRLADLLLNGVLEPNQGDIV